MNKPVFILLFYFAVSQLSYSQPSRNVFINPTGTYILKGEKYKNEIKGSYGEIRVKLLNDSLLAIAMYSNKGYPEYTSASFTDTIAYADNRAVYFPISEASCQLVFDFEADGLNIKQVYTDPASTCGFEKGAIPLGFIARHSTETPIIQSLSRVQ